MKKLLTVVILAFCMTGCNRQVFDLKYKFNKAYVKWPDGTMKVMNVAKWRDYQDSDQIQIIDEKGNVYLLHSVNVALVNEQ